MNRAFPLDFVPVHSLAGRIRITAFDPLESIVSRITYGESAVYGGWIPVIDESGERVRLGVSRIVAEQLDAFGRIEARWTMLYDMEGSLSEGFESRYDPPLPNARDLSSLLMKRLRWVTPLSR